MNELKKIFAPALVAIFTLVLFVFFKAPSSRKLWKNYTVLGVEISAQSEIVDAVLKETGVQEAISVFDQKNDAKFFLENKDFFLPVFSLENDEYFEKRLLYFFDEQKKTRLYYVPDSHKKNARLALSILKNEYGISAFLDGGHFSFFAPLFILIIFAVFLFFSEDKAAFFCGGIFAVLFCFFFPRCSCAAAVCLEFSVLYLAQKVWMRRGAVSFLLSRLDFWIFFALSIFCSFVASAIFAIFFILNIASSFCMLLICSNLRKKKDCAFRFRPVSIFAASYAGRAEKKDAKIFAFSSVATFFIFVFFLQGENFFLINGESHLKLPAPVRYNRDLCDFPVKEDFFVWKWNALLMQYASLWEKKDFSSPPKENDEITILRYKKTGEKIMSFVQTLYTYDENFKKSAILSVCALSPPAIERLWFSQNMDFSVKYESSVGEGGILSFFAMFLAFFAPLFFALKKAFRFQKTQINKKF